MPPSLSDPSSTEFKLLRLRTHWRKEFIKFLSTLAKGNTTCLGENFLNYQQHEQTAVGEISMEPKEPGCIVMLDLRKSTWKETMGFKRKLWPLNNEQENNCRPALIYWRQDGEFNSTSLENFPCLSSYSLSGTLWFLGDCAKTEDIVEYVKRKKKKSF